MASHAFHTERPSLADGSGWTSGTAWCALLLLKNAFKAAPVSQTSQSENRWAFSGVSYSHDEGNCLDRIGRSSFVIAMIARGLPIRSALFLEQAHGRGAWQPAGSHHAVPEPVNHALASTCTISCCCWRRHCERIIFSADSWMRSWASKQLVASIPQFF